MRRVTLGATGIETSCLGFGCASLGSRVPADAGLRGLEAAFDGGVTWIDLAPIYGGGAAEAAIAPFLASHRQEVQLCTKVGLALPGATNSLRSRLMPIARRAVAAVPALRTALRRTGLHAARPLPLTPHLIHGSLEASLRRLGTDRVELYALHDVDPADVTRDSTLRALEEVLASGKARAVAVASSHEAAARAVAQGPPYAAVQFALPEPGAAADLPALAATAGMGALVHSVFGINGALVRLGRRLAADAGARSEAMERTGAAAAEGAAARLLLERAFALNPGGVVLASMFSERSRLRNLAAAARCPEPDAVALVERLAA